MIFIGMLLYFGALIIPAGYLLFTGGRGAACRAMLIGAGLQAFWSVAVWALVYYSWRAGYSDYYYGYAFWIPVNFVGLVYFLSVLLFYGRKARLQK